MWTQVIVAVPYRAEVESCVRWRADTLTPV